jgi:hypothetical protein
VGCENRGSSVGIATELQAGAEGLEFEFRWGKICHFSKSSRPALCPTVPSIHCVVGDISPGVKRQGRETGRLTTYCAEVKTVWICTSTPPYIVN